LNSFLTFLDINSSLEEFVDTSRVTLFTISILSIFNSIRPESSWCSSWFSSKCFSVYNSCADTCTGEADCVGYSIASDGTCARVINGKTLAGEPRTAPTRLWSDGIEDGQDGNGKQCNSASINELFKGAIDV
jgi:hypothetical protein